MAFYNSKLIFKGFVFKCIGQTNNMLFIIEIRSIEHGISPIAKSTMNELFQ